MRVKILKRSFAGAEFAPDDNYYKYIGWSLYLKMKISLTLRIW